MSHTAIAAVLARTDLSIGERPAERAAAEHLHKQAGVDLAIPPRTGLREQGDEVVA